MKKNLTKLLLLACLPVLLVSCNKKLNREEPNATTDAVVFSTLQGYTQAVSKVYAAFATTGSGGSGSGDIAGIDPGTSDFVRLYWNAQELPTDEAVCVWNDPGVPDFHNNNWTSSNVILLGLYYRSIYQITLVNQFINESTPALLTKRGITGASADTVATYVAEARFLRAYQYWVLMDMFGNPPFVTEATPIGTAIPPQITRAKLFAYVESELLAIDGSLKKPHTNSYARVDQAAEWALLSRLYLNAGVYTGTTRYNDAATYAAKVISSGAYTLAPTYANLFKADNNVNNPEVILPVAYDGVNTQNYGGTTFIINSSISAAMNPSGFGMPSGGWAGNHTTQELPTTFGDYSGATDKRAMFYTTGCTENTTDESTFTAGFAITKFTNLTSTGTLLPQVDGVFASTDFPLFRLGEVYLNYIEAVERGGAASGGLNALTLFNALRQRAYGNSNGNLPSISLADVLPERQKELYWEATRRTDLIRFGMFTGGNYLWAFKGGVQSGTSIPDYLSLYPLPASDVTANPNLKQNPGYGN